MSFKDDTFKKMLGLQSVDDNGLGIDPEEVVSGTPGDYNSIFNRGIGDFTGGVPYDVEHKDNVIYRHPDQDLEQTRYDSQTGFSRLVAGTARLLETTATKIGQGAAYLGGLAWESSKYTNPTTLPSAVLEEGNIISRAADNFAVELFAGAEEWAKQANPIFKDRDYREGNFFQQVFNTSFLFDDVVDGLAFMLSSYAPGGALSKAGMGTKFAKGFSSALRKNATGKLWLPNLSAIARNSDKVAMTAFMTASEAMFEAKDVLDSIANDEELINKYGRDQAREIAAQKAKDTFLLNMLFIAPTNLFEASTFFNKTKLFGKVKKSRNGMGIAFDEAGKAIDVTAQKGLKGFLQKPGTKVVGSLIGNVLAEGLYEENIQYTISQAAKMTAKNPEVGTLQSMIKNYNKFIDVAEDGERAKSVALGAAIGGGTTLASNSPLNKLVGGDGGILAEERRKKALRQELIENLNTAQDRTKLDIWKRSPDRNIRLEKTEEGFAVTENNERKIIGEEDYMALAQRANINPDEGGEGIISGGIEMNGGTPQFDNKKMEALFLQSSKREELMDIYDSLVQDPDRNKFSLEFIQREKLANLAKAHFDAGLGEELFDKVDYYSSFSQEEASVFGLNADESSKERAEEYKNYLRELEVMYNSIHGGVIADTNTEENLTINQERQDFLFDRGQRILTLDTLISKNLNDIDRGLDTFVHRLKDVQRRDNQGTPDKLEIAINKIKDLIYEREANIRNVVTTSSTSPETSQYYNKEISKALDNLYENFSENGRLTDLKDAQLGRDFLKSLLINDQLTQQSDELFQEWKTISNIEYGFAYTKKNLEKIRNKYENIRPYQTIDLNDDTTARQYRKWEYQTIKRLEIMKNLEEYDTYIYGERVRQMILEDKSMADIADYLISNNARVDQATLDLLNRYFEDINLSRETIVEERATLEKNIADYREEINFAQGIGDDVEITRLLDEIKKLQGEISDIDEKLATFDKTNGGILANANEVIERLETLRANSYLTYKENDFKLMLADEFMSEFTNIQNAFENDNNYDDLSSVENAYDQLYALKRVFDGRPEVTFSDTFEKAKFMPRLLNAIMRLEDIKKQVEERINNKKLKELNFAKNHYLSVIDSFDVLKQSLGEEAVKFIDDTIDNSPYKEKLIEVLTLIDSDQTDSDNSESSLLPYELATHLYALIFKETNINNYLQEIINEAVTEVATNPLIANKTKEGRGSKKPIEELLWILDKAPDKAIPGILKFFSKRQAIGTEKPNYDATPESSLYWFFKEGNIYDLIKRLESENRPILPSANALLDLVYDLETVNALVNLREIFSASDDNIRSIVQEKKITEKITDTSRLKIPSIHQRLSIQSILNNTLKILSGDTSYAGRFSNFVYLKGPAGAGKTNVVIRWVLDLIKSLDPDQIITAGHQEHSAKGIKDSIKTTYKSNTVAELTKQLEVKDFNKDIKLFVIDEIGGVSQDDLAAFATALDNFITNNDLADNPPAVIVLGDPNQITKDEDNRVGIEIPFSTGILEGIHRIRNAATLFTRYRSNNPAIVNVQNAFIDKVESVSNIQGAINSRLESLASAPDIKGAYVESSTASLMSNFLLSYKNNDGANVIVVDTEAKKKMYEDKITAALGADALTSGKAEVTMYKDVQGRTIENVFVDLKYAEDLYASVTDFNKAMYTATSRAVNFLHLGNIVGGKTVFSPNLEKLIEKNQSDLEQAKEDRLEYLNDLIAHLPIDDALMEEELEEEVVEEEDIEDVTAEQEDEVEENELDPESDTEGELEELLNSMEDSSSEPEVEEEPDTPTETEEATIPEIENEIENYEPVVEGPSTHEGHEKEFMNRKTTEGKQLIGSERVIFEPEYNAFTPIEDAYGKEIWPGLDRYIQKNKDVLIEIFKVSVPGQQTPDVIYATQLQDGNYVRLGMLTEAELDKYPGLDQVSEITFEEPYPSIIRPTAGEVTNSIQGTMIANKSNTLRYLYGDKYRKFDLESIFERWRDWFFSPADKEHDFELANEDTVYKKLRIKIFNDKDIARFRGNMTPAKGVPYLLIEDWRRSTRKGASASKGKPQLVRLTPKKLNNRKHKHLTAPINQYIKTVKKFEKLLQTRYGLIAKLGTPEFGDIVTKLSNIWAKNNVPDFTNKVDLDPNNKYYGNIVKQIEDIENQKELLELAMKVDSLVHGDWDVRPKSQGKYTRLHTGDAQKAFDLIARSNLFVTIDNQDIVLRDTRPTSFKKRAKGSKKSEYTYTVTGRSLLGSMSTKKLTYDDVIDRHMRAYEVALEQREGVQPGTYQGKRLPRTKHLGDKADRVNINVEELEKIFSFNTKGESTARGGFGLRVPIKRSDFNQKSFAELQGKLKLTDYFEENFELVMPTNIVVDFDGASAASQPTQENPVEEPIIEEAEDPEVIDPIADFATDFDEQLLDDLLAEEEDEDLDLAADVVERLGLNLGKEKSLTAINALYYKYLPGTFRQATLRWLKGLIGRTPSEQELYKILDHVQLNKMAGKKAYGRYEKAVMYYTTGAKGGIYEGVFKHEVMHKIVNEYLSREERAELFKLALQEAPSLHNNTEINEYVANRFMEFTATKDNFWSKVKDIFNKILRYLGIVKTYNKDLNDFFEKVNRGYYTTPNTRDRININLDLGIIDDYFAGNARLYKNVENSLLSVIHSLYSFKYLDLVEEKTGRVRKVNRAFRVPLTFEEAKSEALKTFRIRFAKYSKIDFTKITDDQKRLERKSWLLTAKILKNPAVFNKMITSIFGSETDILKPQVVNLSNEIQDVKHEDPRKKIIQEVKQALATIKMGNKFVPFGQAYVILMDAISGIDTTQDPATIHRYLSREAFENSENTPAGQAIKEFMLDVVSNLYPNKNIKGSVEHKWIEFKNDDVVYVDTDGTLDLRNMTEKEIQEVKSVIRFQKEKDLGETQPEFMKRIFDAIRDDLITRKELEFQYKLHRSRNIYATIVTAVGSLRVREPMVGTREYKGDGLVYKYFPNRMSGAKSVLESNIREAIQRHLILNKNLFKFRLPSQRGQTTASKKANIQGFLNSIDFKTKVEFGNKNNVNSLYSSLEHLYSEVSKLDAQADVRNLLADERKFARELADINKTNDSTITATSYIGGDGKKTYTRHNSSFGHEVLRYFQSLLGVGKYQSTFPYLKLDYYKHNIFQNGINRIYKYIDHDSIKFKGLDTSAKQYTQESKLDWLSRNFNHAFIGYTLGGKASSKRYVQFLYPVSNKPGLPGVEIDLLDDGQINEALDNMLIQQQLLPILDNVKNYTRHKNYLLGDSVREIRSKLNDRADELTEYMLNNNFNLDANLSKAFTKIVGNETKPNFKKNFYDQFSEQEKKELGKKKLKDMWEERKREMQENKEDVRAYLRPLVRAFYANFYVNSKQLNSLIAGPEAFYKTGNEPYDIVKRLSIAFGPGRKGVVNNELYLPKESRVIVSEDLQSEVDFVQGVAQELLGDKYEPSDAQGFVTPRYLKKLQKAYGIDSELDITMKPVYFGIDKQGVPRAVKFSTIALTDELVQRFPNLGRVRDMMDSASADIFVFESAVKVGAPKNLTRIYETVIDEDGNKVKKPLVDGEIPKEIDPDSIITIDNVNMRMQHNPAHSPKALATNPSQLTYMPITSPLSLPLQQKILNLNSELIRAGQRIIDKQLRLKYGNRRSGSSIYKIKEYMKKAWDGLSGSENELSLIKNPNIGLNLPLLTNKIISTLNSKIARATVDFKIKGSKLVLQSEFGTYNADDLELKWKDENGFTEVYLPQQLADDLGLKLDDVITSEQMMNKKFTEDEIAAIHKKFKAMGFRLPSTGLHSAIALKVRGFYPSTSERNNIIIAPKRIVWVHGSDYDIDGMFVLNRTTIGDFTEGNDMRLGTLLQEVNDSYNPDLVLDATNVLNYDGNVDKLKLDKNGYPGGDLSFNEFLTFLIEDIKEQSLAILKEDIKGNEALKERLNRLSDIEDSLQILYTNSIKNELVDSFITLLTAQMNRSIMELPITMDRLKGVKGLEEDSMLDIIARMRSGKSKADFIDKDGNFDKEAYETWRNDEELYPPIDLSDVMRQMQIHYNTFSGNVLTGAGANSFKAISYIFNATKTQTWVEQKEYDKLIEAKGDEESFKDIKKYTREDIKKASAEEFARQGKKARNGKPKKGTVRHGLSVLASQGIDLIDFEKEDPITKHPIKVNGAVYNTLSRTEKKSDGGTLVDNEVVVGTGKDGEEFKRTYTIWESLDSLINAAIDNVKEQILYLINLKDKTANQMFSMIALGIPLDTVVRIVNQPEVIRLSEMKKVDVATINKMMSAHKNQFLKLETGEEDIAKIKEDRMKVLEKQIEDFELNDERLEEAAILFNTNKKPTKEYYLTQYKALEAFGQATKMGDSLFDLSRASSILRKFPSTYAELKTLKETIENNISNFGDTYAIIEEKERIRREVQESLEEDPVYETLSKKERGAYVRALIKEKEEERNLDLRADRSTYNQLMRNEHSGYSKPSGEWSFPNASLLEVPNFRESFKVVMKLIGIYEQLFYKHSSAVNEFTSNILKQLYTRSADAKYTQIETIKNELITFLNTALNINFENTDFSLKIDPRLVTSVGEKRIYGFKAWTTQLIRRLRDLKDKYQEHNEFLKALEFGWNEEYQEETIIFTSDKVSDPVQAQIYKHSFAQLSHSAFRKEDGSTAEQEFSNIQLDLFKYLLLSRGTGFGRTSYSSMIPNRMYEALYQAMEPFYKELLLADDKMIASSEILNSISDQFLLQFIQNNPGFTASLDSQDPRIQRDEENDNKLSGVHQGKVYNLKLKGNGPKVFKYFRSLYFKSFMDDEGNSYYQKFGNVTRNRYYYISREAIDRGFDPAKVFNGTPILPVQVKNGGLKGRTYVTPTNQPQQYKPGQIIYLRESYDIGLTELKQYRIEKVNKPIKLKVGRSKEDAVAYSYEVRSLGNLSIANNKKAAESISENRYDPPSTEDLRTMYTENSDRIGFKAGDKISSEKLIDLVLGFPEISKSVKEILTQFQDKVPTSVNFTEVIINRNSFKEHKALKRARGLLAENEVFLSIADISSRKELGEVLAHELAHLYSLDTTQKGSRNELEPESREQEWYNKVYDLWVHAVNNGLSIRRSLNPYFYENVDEFIAHGLTNDQFRRVLDRIPAKGEKKSILRKLIDFVLELVGLKGRPNSVLKELIELGLPQTSFIPAEDKWLAPSYYHFGIDQLSKTPTKSNLPEANLNGAESRSEDIANRMANAIREKKKRSRINILDTVLSKITEIGAVLTPNQENYTDNEGNIYERLTHLVKENFSTSKIKDNLEEHLAKQDFKNQGKLETETVSFNLKEYTLQERIDYYKKAFNTGRSKGRFVHGYIELLLEKDQVKRKLIAEELNRERTPKTGETDMQDGYTAKSFKWIEENLGKILEASGLKINFKNNIYRRHEADRFIPEQIVTSPTLKVGTRIDGLVEHADGTVSIVDWKTGSLLSDLYTRDILKYGEKYKLNNSKLNRAKLEVMFRALALKELDPTISFKYLSVNYLTKHSENGVKTYHVEMDQYLNVIANYLKDTNSQAYERFNEQGLFNPTTYRSKINVDSNFTKMLRNKTLQEQKQIVEAELLKIQLEFTEAAINNDADLKKKVTALTKLRAELEDIKDTDFNVDAEDLSGRWFEGYLSNLQDAKNPWAVAFKKLLFNKKQKFEDEYKKNEETHDNLLRAVLREYTAQKGLLGLAETLKNKINYVPILGGLNKRELFAFMWKEYEGEGITGWHANLDDTYIDWRTGQPRKLTAAQKAYRDYYHSSMKKMYKNTMGNKVLNQFGKKVSKAEIQKLPNELHEVFMPRVAKSMSDLTEENENLGLIGKTLRRIFQRSWTDFLQAGVSGDRETGVPLRYYAGLDSEIIHSNNFSFDAERAYKQFTRNVIFKHHMDDAYAFGKGIKTYLATKNDPITGKPLYPNLSKFIENHILLHVVRSTPDGDLTKKETKVTVPENVANSWIGKQLGLESGYMYVNTFRLGRQLKQMVSVVGMAFKPVRGLFNGALIISLNHLKALSGSIAKRFRGVDNVDYSLSDIAAADYEWVKYVIGKWMWGNKAESKMWNLAHKLQYLPDNYDYLVSNEETVVTKNTLFDKGNMFWFHTIFENYGSMTMLAASLRAMKVTLPDGTKTNMWELHNEKGEYTGPVRGKLKDGTLLTGLSKDEVGHLKRLYERLHGSYRQEERLALELSVLGQWVLQFKKYFPTMLKMQFKGLERDYTLGQYVPALGANNQPLLDENGMSIYEWEGKMTQGRLNLMAQVFWNHLASWTNIKEFNSDLEWDNLSNEQKQVFVEGATTLLFVFLFPLAFLDNVIPDDDKDKRWTKAAYKVVQDISLGLHPSDILNPLTRPTAVFPKLKEIWEFGAQFLMDGLIKGETDREGRPKGWRGVYRTLPVGSSIYQFNTFMEEVNEDYTLFQDKVLLR